MASKENSLFLALGIFLVVTFVVESHKSPVTDLNSDLFGCFDVWANTHAVCVNPSQTMRRRVHEATCLRTCVAKGHQSCTAVDFTPPWDCRMYKTTIDVPRFYNPSTFNTRSTAAFGNCRYAKVARRFGTVHYRASQLCGPDYRPPPPQPITTRPVVTSTEAPWTPPATNAPPLPTNPGSIPVIDPEHTKQTSGKLSCPVNEHLRYLYFHGMRLVGQTQKVTFPIATAEDCLFACSENLQTSLDASATFHCRSAEFSNADGGTCAISAGHTDDQTVYIETDAAVDYYEQICLKTDGTHAFNGQTLRCPGPFVVQPQQVLMGATDAIVNATSFGECLQLCLDSPARRNLHCQSAMFFYDETQFNCMLNTGTASSHPNDFDRESDIPVDYFETRCTTDGSPGAPNDSIGTATRHPFVQPSATSPESPFALSPLAVKQFFLSRDSLQDCNALRHCCALRTTDNQPNCARLQGYKIDETFRVVTCDAPINC